MLGFFPTALKDECFYSLCARYAQIVKYPGRENAIIELFKRRGLSIAIDLPSSLNTFISEIGVKCNFSAQKIIQNNSLLPYYAPFLPHDRVEKLFQLMKSSTGEAVHKISGITATTINRPNKLKFCPSCALEENTGSGILYWHRLHQLAGVFVCPKHHCFLENSAADLTKNSYKANLFYPNEYISVFKPRNLNSSDKNHQVLLSIAKDSEWLLNGNIKCSGYDRLESIYMSILKENDLVTIKGRINLTALRDRFRSCYNNKLLDLLQCNFDDNKEYQWVSRIIPHLRMQKVHHPLRHLLLIRLLGHNPETFFFYSINETKQSQIEHSTYFIEGPYPCLNPICGDYKKLTINSYEIKDSYGKKKFKTLYVTCKCNFSYYRNGPDIAQEDIYRKRLVINFGNLWERECKKLWKDKSVSIHRMSKILGVSANTIKNRALALGLEFPRSGPGNKVVITDTETSRKKQNQYLAKKNKDHKLQVKIDDYRKKWLSIRELNPELKRSKLVKIAPSIARWLRIHDREWFYLNQPPVWKRVESARQIDWKPRDIESAQKVRQIAAEIKEREGKPVWIKPGSIAQEFMNRDWITNNKYLKKMPLTNESLKEVTENRIDYNVRRIHWAVNCIKEDGSSFAFSSIGLRSVVAWYLWKDPKIKQAIEDGIVEIKKHRGLI